MGYICWPVTLSPLSDPCSVCGRRLRSFWFRDSEPCFLDSITEPAASWTPIAGPWAAHCFPALPASALRKAPLLPTESSASALRKAPFLPTESSASAYGELRHSFRFLIVPVNKPVFLQLNPPGSRLTEGSDHLHGFSGDSWFAGTVSRQQRSYGSTGREYAEHRTSGAGVSSACPSSLPKCNY